jgi:soluble lytic murein transglycosylase-like protein
MKLVRMAGVTAALIAGTLVASPVTSTPAEAAIFSQTRVIGVKNPGSRSVSIAKVRTKKIATKKVGTKKVSVRKRGQVRNVARSSRSRGVPAGRGHVVATIKQMAPSYGVPTWFALRIAQIESSYNPNARGGAGEYGVYQLKCATARGIGFRGNCGALLNARTNIMYGLKHLSSAIRLSRGNLRLAASKHNGGLGRRSLVPVYVNRVF